MGEKQQKQNRLDVNSTCQRRIWGTGEQEDYGYIQRSRKQEGDASLGRKNKFSLILFFFFDVSTNHADTGNWKYIMSCQIIRATWEYALQRVTYTDWFFNLNVYVYFNSLNKCFLHTCQVPGVLLDVRDPSINTKCSKHGEIVIDLYILLLTKKEQTCQNTFCMWFSEQAFLIEKIFQISSKAKEKKQHL